MTRTGGLLAAGLLLVSAVSTGCVRRDATEEGRLQGELVAAQKEAQRLQQLIAREPSQGPIAVASLGPDRVIGYLGFPLGTVVRVTGTATVVHSRRKATDERPVLRIESVNGHPLSTPADFPVPDGYANPGDGVAFDLYVHEQGSFSGVVDPPPALRDESWLPVTHDGFRYRPDLVVHKVVSE